MVGQNISSIYSDQPKKKIDFSVSRIYKIPKQVPVNLTKNIRTI